MTERVHQVLSGDSPGSNQLYHLAWEIYRDPSHTFASKGLSLHFVFYLLRELVLAWTVAVVTSTRLK